MKQKRRSSSLKVGQADIFGEVYGLDKLVAKPDVIEESGLRVIHFAISEEDKFVPGYLSTVKEQARKLEPEVKSSGKPPWANAHWQAQRRKRKAQDGNI